ncbi:NAD(P)/FAD-dependent oxidoreductase [Castellaniella sp.]|uniref:NAD(P)/FAD-dependent oxidoreductase n=1 Tax=Castellaniella sp. TaxID=1955812 RepID=UPI00355D963D
MSELVDCVVIGAGVVGLAVARACARNGQETILVDAAATIGTGTSSRNSEVVHAGIYYAPESLKARLCVRGRSLLYAYCESHGVSHRRCGKLIVVTNERQLPVLHALVRNGKANGVTGIQLLDGVQARSLEPALRCLAAIESSVTGIVDSHGLMMALLGDLEAAGGVLALYTRVEGGSAHNGEGIRLCLSGSAPHSDSSSFEIRARHVFNCAGLQATAVSRSIEGIPALSIPKIWFAKGNYYALRSEAPFSRLIYPIPESGGLGVHLTLDLNRRARFGPDVEWVEGIDYAVDPTRVSRFYEAIRQYWPDLPDDSLYPDYAGIRSKLHGPSGPEADFLIQGVSQHGVSGLVNLYGIESPGLTSALAIAEEALLAMD